MKSVTIYVYITTLPKKKSKIILMQTVFVSPFLVGVGYINLSLSCIILCTILYWIFKLVKFTIKSRKELQLVKCQDSDVYQVRELTNKRTNFHKGLLLLLILTTEFIQKTTAITTYAVINLVHSNRLKNETINGSSTTACFQENMVELYSVMQHTPAVLVLRALSNVAILGMLSTISLALTYLMNAYGQRGDRRNFKRLCHYSLMHCALVLILSCSVQTLLLGYLLYGVLSAIDFLLVVRCARQLNSVLRARTAEARLEFGRKQYRIHEQIQRRYCSIVTGVIVCLFLFVLGVLLHRVSIVLGIFLNHPCFLFQVYNLDVRIHLSENQLRPLVILSKILLVSFYLLILVFDCLFIALNAAAILINLHPSLGMKNIHSDKKNRELLDPLIKRYQRSLH